MKPTRIPVLQYIRVGLHRSEKAWSLQGLDVHGTGYSEYSVAWACRGWRGSSMGVLRVLNGLGLRGLEGLEAL